MLCLKKVKKFSTNNKVMNYNWLGNHIIEAGENVVWVNGEIIFKHTLKSLGQGLAIDYVVSHSTC